MALFGGGAGPAKLHKVVTVKLRNGGVAPYCDSQGIEAVKAANKPLPKTLQPTIRVDVNKGKFGGYPTK